MSINHLTCLEDSKIINMQVKDLITFYINESAKTLDVTFRLETDGEEEVRNDSILIEEVESFGYKFLNDSNNMFDEELLEEDFNNDFYDNMVDEDEVISFLNEYYIINSNKLPPIEPF